MGFWFMPELATGWKVFVRTPNGETSTLMSCWYYAGLKGVLNGGWGKSGVNRFRLGFIWVMNG